ncbi:MAG TPA: hypothetical protein VMZ91_02940 [Candidatus Paceibacterota bacterium]|nr:hypothetical protein [Candidatus Paceibacterota bacterium]
MEFTIQEILGMRDILTKVVQAEVPIRTAFRINRFVKSVQMELETFEKTRMGLIQKYGEKEENNQQISVKDPQKQKEFQTEIQKVIVEIINIDFNPIRFEEFGNDIKISAAELFALEKIIIFPDQVKKEKKAEEIEEKKEEIKK